MTHQFPYEGWKKDYVESKQISKSQTSDVFLAEHVQNKEKVIIKKIIISSDQEFSSFNNQVGCLNHFQNQRELLKKRQKQLENYLESRRENEEQIQSYHLKENEQENKNHNSKKNDELEEIQERLQQLNNLIEANNTFQITSESNQTQGIIVLKYYTEAINFYQFLQQSSFLLCQRRVLSYFLQMCDGVQCMHFYKVYHRNISYNSFLYCPETDKSILTHFKDSFIANNFTSQNQYQKIGLSKFSSPQQFLNLSNTDEKNDIWSLGIILYFMLYQEFPFDFSGSWEQIFEQFHSYLNEKFVLKISPNTHPDIKKILDETLHPQEKNRPSLSSITNDLRKHLFPYSTSLDLQTVFITQTRLDSTTTQLSNSLLDLKTQVENLNSPLKNNNNASNSVGNTHNSASNTHNSGSLMISHATNNLQQYQSNINHFLYGTEFIKSNSSYGQNKMQQQSSSNEQSYQILSQQNYHKESGSGNIGNFVNLSHQTGTQSYNSRNKVSSSTANSSLHQESQNFQQQQQNQQQQYQQQHSQQQQTMINEIQNSEFMQYEVTVIQQQPFQSQEYQNPNDESMEEFVVDYTKGQNESIPLPKVEQSIIQVTELQAKSWLFQASRMMDLNKYNQKISEAIETFEEHITQIKNIVEIIMNQSISTIDKNKQIKKINFFLFYLEKLTLFMAQSTSSYLLLQSYTILDDSTNFLLETMKQASIKSKSDINPELTLQKLQNITKKLGDDIIQLAPKMYELLINSNSSIYNEGTSNNPQDNFSRLQNLGGKRSNYFPSQFGIGNNIYDQASNYYNYDPSKLLSSMSSSHNPFLSQFVSHSSISFPMGNRKEFNEFLTQFYKISKYLEQSQFYQDQLSPICKDIYFKTRSIFFEQSESDGSTIVLRSFTQNQPQRSQY